MNKILNRIYRAFFSEKKVVAPEVIPQKETPLMEISCLVKGLIKSIESESWELLGDGSDQYIKKDEIYIHFNKNGCYWSLKEMNVWSSFHVEFNKLETYALWEVIEHKFPDNYYTKTAREEKQREESKLAAQKRFETLGCGEGK